MTCDTEHYTPFQSTPRIQDNIHNIRKVPGDFSSIVTCIKVALVSPEEHISTALKIRNLIIAIDPDMGESFDQHSFKV